MRTHTENLDQQSRIELTQRWREAFQATGEGRKPGEVCPEPEKIWAAVRLELPEAERRGVVDHTATCAACAEDWRIAWSFVTEEQSHAGQGDVVAGPWRRHLPQLTAAAALLALAVGVGVVLERPGFEAFRGSSAPVEASRGEVSTESGGEVFRGEAPPAAAHSLLPPGAALPRQNLELRWSEGPPGSRYEVRVMTETLETVATGKDLTRPHYRVPPEAVEGLSSGDLLLWQVDTFAREGSVTTSATFTNAIE